MKQLAIHLDAHSVQFDRWVNEELEATHAFYFQDKTDFGYKDQLEIYLNKTEFRTLDWDDYTLTWSDRRTTLLPFSVFQMSNPVAAYQLSFGKPITEDRIQYDRIPEAEITNVYDCPGWVKEFFVPKFARLLIQHEGSQVIRNLFFQNHSQRTLHLRVHQDFCALIAMENRQLKFYNSYRQNAPEDLLYHCANLIEKQNWKEKDLQILLSSSLENAQSIRDEVVTTANKINLFKHVSWSELTPITQIQTTCV